MFANIHARQWNENKGKPLPEAAAEIQNTWVEKLCLPVLYVLSSLEGQAYVTVPKQTLPLSTYRLPFPSVAPGFSLRVNRRNTSPGYLRSFLQSCDNVSLAYLV